MLPDHGAGAPCGGGVRLNAAFGKEEAAVGLEHCRGRVTDAPGRKAAAQFGARQYLVRELVRMARAERAFEDDAARRADIEPAGDVQQQFAAAADEYSRAFNSRPSVDLALREFAAAKQAGRERPEQSLLRWSESNPRDARANFALGTVALESGDHAAAEARYELVLEVDPTHVGALNNLAWLYDERGDPRAVRLARGETGGGRCPR